jgi:hypothetical protein
MPAQYPATLCIDFGKVVLVVNEMGFRDLESAFGAEVQMSGGLMFVRRRCARRSTKALAKESKILRADKYSKQESRRVENDE